MKTEYLHEQIFNSQCPRCGKTIETTGLMCFSCGWGVRKIYIDGEWIDALDLKGTEALDDLTNISKDAV